LEIPKQKEREKERIQKENKKTWLEENKKYIYIYISEKRIL
jgi:hypothetical protein